MASASDFASDPPRRRRRGDGGRDDPPSGGEGSLRSIPADHDAERAVLGAVLLDHEALLKIVDKVDADSFDLPRHRILWSAFESLSQKAQAIDVLTVRAWLTENGLFDDAGGMRFLNEVSEAVTTAVHVEYHADLVRDRALARALIRTCETIASRGYDQGEPIRDLVGDAEREILQVAMGGAESGFSSMRDEIQETFDYIEQVQSGQIAGVRTGFEDFDKLTGGLNGGELVVLAARPSMGKTAFGLNIARNHAIDERGCVGFFCLEMTKRELVLRLLMSESQVDNSRFRNGMLSDRDWRELTRAATVLEETEIYFDDSMAVTISDITAKARRLDREHKLSLLIIDYIQLIAGRSNANERREQQVAEISRSLKMLSKELDIPIIALSQLNRGPENRPDKRPQLADLRESGAIEQDADIVMFIYRDEVYDEESPDVGIAEIIISKQRNGATGTTRLQFTKENGRFHDLAARDAIPPVEVGFGSARPEPPPGDDWGAPTLPDDPL